MKNIKNCEIYEKRYIERFLNGISKRKDSCWIWLKAKNSEGYGYLWNGNFCERVHRFSFKIYKQPIPKDKILLHTCDNPSCCNPEHLVIGTRGENNTDRALKGRNRKQNGEDNSSSKLTWKKVERIRNSPYSRKKLAKIYSVSRKCIDNIINKKTWIIENVELYDKV